MDGSYPNGALVPELFDGGHNVGKSHFGHQLVHPHLVMVNQLAQIMTLASRNAQR